LLNKISNVTPSYLRHNDYVDTMYKFHINIIMSYVDS